MRSLCNHVSIMFKSKTSHVIRLSAVFSCANNCKLALRTLVTELWRIELNKTWGTQSEFVICMYFIKTAPLLSQRTVWIFSPVYQTVMAPPLDSPTHTHWGKSSDSGRGGYHLLYFLFCSWISKEDARDSPSYHTKTHAPAPVWPLVPPPLLCPDWSPGVDS